MSKQTLLQKVWEINKAIPSLKKSAKGFKFNYVDLEDIESRLIPLMEEKGIWFQHTSYIHDSGKNILRTVLYDKDSDDSLVSEIAIPDGVLLPSMNPFQSLGSGYTYYRRYNLVILFDILGTDNDVDSVTPVVEEKPDYVKKVKSLVALGRKRASLEKYFAKIEDKLSDDERNEIIKIITELNS